MLAFVSFSQNWNTYRAEKDKIHNLIHTKLKVDFNFKEKQLNGEAWVTVKPHFYATNKISLDAKGMIIHQVSLNNNSLPYNYNNFKLLIDLPKKYTKDEEFTIYVKYTARPEKVKQKAIAEADKAKDEYLAMAGFKTPDANTEIDAGESKKVTGTKLA